MMKYTALMFMSAVMLAGCKDKSADIPNTPDIPLVPAASAPKAPAAPKAPQSISDLTLDEFSQDLAGFVGIKAGDEMEAVKDQIRLYMAGDGDGSNAQAASFQTHYRTDGRTLFVATQNDLRDDSVSAQQVMVVFIPKTMSKSIVEGYGLRVKCRRSSDIHKWQVKPC
jgi:hypothetical protein